MGREDGRAIMSSTCFQLGVAGAQITRSFSLLIQHTGLTHKQVGLLAVVDADQASSQREIAAQLGVAPSLVVSLVDQLANIGAVRRTRSQTDRRVQVVEITDEGRQLLRLATDAAKKLDVELHKHLSPADLQALDRLLPALLRASSVAAGNRP
ncbi:winged helix-turn-helix transcriptional regulator [Actinomyces johnsonii]|uniref:Winged helix-turn-helix transcriptional regulator n=2 Tax=Actinomyces johnsonii TaxID=544581 RepID=A0A508A4Q8_9ACTO|nr:MarR family winged helix-turn-helix transcriptional regulator [Actinomyces johnsonii]KAA8740112.1 winged helix-turn-helix transcriptional regulator [Actinomyces johnsonii]TQD44317.1 winged helix-turn-helix transcriptional regulator [Actinomyces johnsonii]